MAWIGLIFVKCLSYQRISVCQSLSSATKGEVLFEESQAGCADQLPLRRWKGGVGFLLLFCCCLYPLVSLWYFNQHERTYCTPRAVQFEKAISRLPNRFATYKVVLVCGVKDQICGSRLRGAACQAWSDDQEIAFRIDFAGRRFLICITDI